MTDEQIVEGLKCCNNGLCEICPYREEEEFSADCRERNGTDVLDLIARQKAKIERLKKGWRADVVETANAIDEAIRKFVERLKKESYLAEDISGMYCVNVVETEWIEDLAKELTEETP